MKNKKSQLLSILLLGVSVLIELSESKEWIDYSNKELAFGLSLACIIVSMSFNVKIVRDLSSPRKESANSIILLFLSIGYTLVAFGFELI